MKNLMILLVFLLTVSINAQCWQKVSVGDDYTLAIKSDGTLWAWGNNDAGQLGDGTTADKYTITQVETDNNWQSVSAGSNTSYGIKTDGTLWAWGNGGLGELGNGGFVFGEIGFDENNYSYTPIQVGSENNWLSVNAGTGHVIALKANGTLWAWGYNAYGQIGDGTGSGGALNIKKYPTQIGTLTNWQYINCGFRSSFAIKSDGTLWAWGRNNFGQLGVGDNIDKNVPTQVGTSTDWQSISSNGVATIAIKSNGTLWSWGGNQYWSLGTGEFSPNTNVPGQVGTASNWQSVSAGGQIKALKTNGTLWAWGEGFYGFGDGSNISKDVPTQIGTQTDWSYIISGNATHSAVLKTNNTLWNWGWNSSGQLANGTNTGNASNNTQNLPIQVSCATLGIEDFSNRHFEIYPNPVKNILFIDNKESYLIQKIRIADSTGRIILEKNDTVSEINMQNYQNGIYILSIISENKILNYKIVKN